MSDTIKVIGWISYDEHKSYDGNALGGMGGFFNFYENKGMRWKDYLNEFMECVYPYAEAFRMEILEKEMYLEFDGGWHQESKKGVPLFSDNSVSTFSFRAWGDIMAAIWSEKEDKDWSYMDFYYS